ncbi:MAG: hypothetical protein HKN32_01135, partial [Flavobacteriales bacterium]|nr:hypothetical protein [Flavobacteriales bacterium]
MGNNLTNFEQSVRSSLDGFEMAYEPAAWDDLESRLDAAGQSSSSNHLTLALVAASLIVALGMTMYFTLSSEGNEGLLAEPSVQVKDFADAKRFAKIEFTENEVNSEASLSAEIFENQHVPVEIDETTIANLNNESNTSIPTSEDVLPLNNSSSELAQTDPNSDDQANSEESLADENADSENSDEIVFVSN